MRRLSTASSKPLCDSDLEESVREAVYKIIALSAVSCSILAIMAVAITLPIVYNFVDHIQKQTKRELDLCKVAELTSKLAIC